MTPQGPPTEPARLHKVNRRHLEALTGELGILQHATGSTPDPEHGYCVDDVARALEVDLLHARVLGWPAVAESAARSLAFLEAAFDVATGRFRNFRAIDGSWLAAPASNDSNGRAMLALGQLIGVAPDPGMEARASTLFERALPKAARMTSPRAEASVVLACLAATSGPAAVAAAAASLAAATTGSATRRHVTTQELQATAVMRTLATDLHARVQSFARPGWPWPEPALTYENALLPRAMILAGQRLGARSMLAIGLQVLDWLIDVQTADDGHLTPVGNGWWEHDGTRSRFDQQPIEPTSLLLAAEAALGVTGKGRYRAAMERSYAWFLGGNDLSVRIAEPARGACRDGLTAEGVNTNEGAESTLMWLIALEHIRSLRAEQPAVEFANRIGVAPGLAVHPPPPEDVARRDGRLVTIPTPLFLRSAANPILTAADVPYPANTIFNPGATRVDGETILLARVEDLRGISQLHVARSSDGETSWRFDPEPLLRADVDHDPEETWGCEDPRLTWLPEREEWAIAYTAYSRRGPLVSLATTRDFRTVRRLGPVMPPEDKDAALFPRRFGSRWAMVHRPSPLRGGAHMWISYSPDMRHWGDHELLLEARDGAWWDAGKIGLGPPPLETPEGWLLMYHGVRLTSDGPIYRVGLALLDLADPGTVLHKTDEWVFGPEAPYEMTGDVGRVVFPCGWIHDEAVDRLRIYYGAADTVIGLATARFSDVMARVLSTPRLAPRA